MKIIITISLLLICYMGFSQNSGVGINSTGANPDPSAGLDVDFNDKGILIPRLTTIQRDGIQVPAVGLQVYNTTENCLQVYLPLSGWRDVSCDCQMSPSSSAFTFTDSIGSNSNVVFTAGATGLNYSWTFQNGTPSTSSLQAETVTWANPGIYGVTLTVTDNVGCTSSTTDSITVLACPPPLALNFTNCTQTGRTGPSQGQCNSAYTGTPLANNVTVTSGIQEWTVPQGITTISIEAGGAQGGGANGGLGAKMKAHFPVTPGETIKILVGQKGLTQSGQPNSVGGGGGTFVVRPPFNTSGSILLVAGGGGGSPTTYSNNRNGTTLQNGQAGAGSGGAGSAGSNGNGGGATNRAGGGGGFLANGACSTQTCASAEGGYAFINGGNGGDHNDNGVEGSFGGGGAAWQTGFRGSGGGGGYSGGGSGYEMADNSNHSGGGGGSYIGASATNVSTSDGQYNGSSTFNGNSITNLNSHNSGDGYVIITSVCP